MLIKKYGFAFLLVVPNVIAALSSIATVCNQLGTACTIRGTDHILPNGACACHVHVQGRSCDACAPGYYGLWRGVGCLPCAHCDITGTIAADARGLMECDGVTGECLCNAGYRGPICNEQIPSIGDICENCKPNCYRYANKCRDCGECYKLVQERFEHYLQLKSNTSAVDRMQQRYKDLENEIKNMGAKVKAHTAEDMDVDQYYSELELLRKSLMKLKSEFYFSRELDTKLKLIDKNVTDITQMKDNFRKQLQNLANTTQNAELAKLTNAIISTKDEITNHLIPIIKISNETNKTCKLTCQKYGELDNSLGDHQKLIKALQEKTHDLNEIRKKSDMLLRDINKVCIDLSELNLPTVEEDIPGPGINNLDEKLELYKKADNLLSQYKHSNLDKMVTAKAKIENSIDDFYKFVADKQKTLENFTKLMETLQSITFESDEIEKRLARIKSIIQTYFKQNKDLISSLEVLRSMGQTDEKLDTIAREIELLTLELKQIQKINVMIRDQLIKANDEWQKQLTMLSNKLKELNRQWKEVEKNSTPNDVYDFILMEIANEASLKSIEEEIDEGFELLRITKEKEYIDIELEYMRNVKEELDKLVIPPPEICGTKTGDADDGN